MERIIATTPGLSAGERGIAASRAMGAEREWGALYRIGAWSSIAVLVMIPLQIVLYVAYPPPATVEGFFSLMRRSPLLGLISLDLFYMISVILSGVVMLAVCVALRRASPSLIAVALFLMVIGSAAYFASSVAFDMLRLSGHHAAATTESGRGLFLAAGEGMLASYQGSAFNVYYILLAIAGLLIAIVMLRDDRFARITPRVGLVMMAMMLVPPTAGAIGLVFAFASLIPTALWLVLVARDLLRLARMGDRE